MIEIKNKWNGQILFSGEFASLKDATQEAVKKKANLGGADLGGADLGGAYLGGAYLRGAYLRSVYLRGADLGGADLGGAYLGGADLRGADLRGAYLGGAYLRGAYLRSADLRGADLGGADLRGANLRSADLRSAKIRDGITITQVPIQISGLTWDITIWDNYMQIGCEFHSHTDWRGFDDGKWLQMGGKNALRLKQEHLNTLLALCDSHAREVEKSSERASETAGQGKG